MTRALQRKIFVGCRELGLDQAARRGLQLAVTGKASLSDMDETELKAVIKRLENDGFKPSSKGRKKPAKAPRPDLRLIHVLWRKLGEADALKDPSRAGLNAFIRTRFTSVWGSVPADIDMMRDAGQIDQVVQALKSWGQRVDIDFDWRSHQR